MRKFTSRYAHVMALTKVQTERYTQRLIRASDIVEGTSNERIKKKNQQFIDGVMELNHLVAVNVGAIDFSQPNSVVIPQVWAIQQKTLKASRLFNVRMPHGAGLNGMYRYTLADQAVNTIRSNMAAAADLFNDN